MMKRILLVLALAVVVGVVGLLYFHEKENVLDADTQLVLQSTLTISKKYVSLRYRTDNVLLHADEYSEFVAWKSDLNSIISDWEQLEKDAQVLETESSVLDNRKISFWYAKTTYAYTHEEIQNIFDSAPAGKKIATLAKHLGTDAKTAYTILRDESSIEAETWNKRGDTFQALESTATVIKDGCKVAGFVGSIALTGGTSAIMAGSTLAKVAVVVSGADLTLEITDDAAKIAFGNHNKISKIVGDVRVVTEPAASLLMISELPKNLTKGIEKLNAVSFGLEQFNSTVQEGKTIGIKLPVYTGKKTKQVAQATVMDTAEVAKWIEEQGVANTPETKEEVETILQNTTFTGTLDTEKAVLPHEQQVEADSQNQTETRTSEINSEVVGVWEGIMTWTESSTASEQSELQVIEFKADGSMFSDKGNWSEYIWKLEGSSLKIYDPANMSGYHEFAVRGNELVFVKIAGPDEEGTWSEVLAGSDFFGGKYMELTLVKQ